MSKQQKTNKSVRKRIRITGTKKLFRRSLNQSHFNAKDSGDKTRSKRKDKQISMDNKKKIKKLLPNY